MKRYRALWIAIALTLALLMTVPAQAANGPVVLVILDGFGVSDTLESNAAAGADMANLARYEAMYPHTTVEAAGLAVGLPEGQMGSSEVGHMNIGAGRVVYQELTRITKDIEEGGFFDNSALTAAIDAARENGANVHLIGLVSDGGVHSHQAHLHALLEMCAERGMADRTFVHAFLDGRDTLPMSAEGYLDALEQQMEALSSGKLASMAGRYYPMDRDGNWDRIEVGYAALIGEGATAANWRDALAASYAAGVTDEFAEPVVFVDSAGELVGPMQPGDTVIFFHFRADRARGLTEALTDPIFNGFARPGGYLNPTFVTMTDYGGAYENVSVAYPPQTIEDSLGAYLSAQGICQMRIAESEKYAHVAYFFNGGVEEPYPGEERFVVESVDGAGAAMQAEAITDAAVGAVMSGKYGFIVINYANTDTMGHTGDYHLAVEGCEITDACVGRLLDAVVAAGGMAIVTSDHGNCEQMTDPVSGQPFTAHTENPVPLLLVAPGQSGIALRADGKLADVAPTILALMGIEQPQAMTGESLIRPAQQ